MALAQETNVLLLDEPTTALDIEHQYEVLELCRRLNRDHGTTIVAVLRDLRTPPDTRTTSSPSAPAPSWPPAPRLRSSHHRWCGRYSALTASSVPTPSQTRRSSIPSCLVSKNTKSRMSADPPNTEGDSVLHGRGC
ncbi:hypothetical protein [Sphingomonas sp. LR61]|uniref:hypothetical protein n=1 Tax=Sphingomonas sp. LR61 TaxID=3050234 RepID=UPI003FA71F16